MEIVWNVVDTDQRIEFLQKYFGQFNDACIKEFKYESGSYVNPDGSMKPHDSERKAYLIIQKQNKVRPVVEFMFEGVERANIVPSPVNYDSMLSGILLERKDGFIFFATAIVTIDSLERSSDWVTWIKAKSVKWREAPQYIGDATVYVHKDL